MQDKTDQYPHRQVQQQRYSYHLHHLLPQTSSQVLRAQYRSTDIDDFEYQKSKHDYLIHNTYCRHTFIRVLTQHDGVYGTKHHNQKGFNEYRNNQFGQFFPDADRPNNRSFNHTSSKLIPQQTDDNRRHHYPLPFFGHKGTANRHACLSMSEFLDIYQFPGIRNQYGSSGVPPVNGAIVRQSDYQAVPKNEDRGSSHGYEPAHAT